MSAREKYTGYRRCLSICNRLSPSKTKARHVARIFRALNQLRAAA
jgi:hypothetical protein